VDVAHEAGVHDRDPLVCGDRGEERLGFTGVGGDPHVEAEGPQIALERGSRDRLTGEDGGRQTNSLPGCRRGGAGMCVAGARGPRWPGGVSAEAIG
jgi:hypothetical protein